MNKFWGKKIQEFIKKKAKLSLTLFFQSPMLLMICFICMCVSMYFKEMAVLENCSNLVDIKACYRYKDIKDWKGKQELWLLSS